MASRFTLLSGLRVKVELSGKRICTFGDGNTKVFFELLFEKRFLSYLEKEFLEAQNAFLLTPIKKTKGQKDFSLFERLLSSSIHRARQPIESLLNWIQEKTFIQVVSKVPSYNGLMVHLFARLAASFFLLAFNS